MKLFVDDDRECPIGWELARTITESISMIARNEYEEISLDLHMTDDDSETFEPVARFIHEKYPVVMPELWCHSDDPKAILLYRQIIGLGIGLRSYPDEYESEG